MVFVRNPLFQIYGYKALQIFLYQDEFEVCNPLGQGRGKHKIFAVYFTLGNLHMLNCSKVDSLQLTLLCKCRFVEKCTLQSLFHPLLEDLKIIEEEGIDLDFEGNIKGTVICIAGDNLGSHFVSGFMTNFGSSEFLCRYCTARPTEFMQNPFQEIPLGTASTYADVQLGNRLMLDHVNGIKFASPFNNLKYFHVCNPGMPPCTAHDLFEGIIAYDLILIIKRFIYKRWFT